MVKNKSKKLIKLKNLSNIVPTINIDKIKIPKISLDVTKKKLNNFYENYKKIKEKKKLIDEKNRKLEKKRELERQKKQAARDRAKKLQEEKSN